MTQTSDTTTTEAVRAQLARMRDRTNTFAGDQNLVSKAQYADDVSLLLDALEAAVTVEQASVNLYARVALGVTANRMRGNDEAADNDEREYLQPWDEAAENYRATLAAIAATLEVE